MATSFCKRQDTTVTKTLKIQCIGLISLIHKAKVESTLCFMINIFKTKFGAVTCYRCQDIILLIVGLLIKINAYKSLMNLCQSTTKYKFSENCVHLIMNYNVHNICVARRQSEGSLKVIKSHSNHPKRYSSIKNSNSNIFTSIIRLSCE